MSLSLVVVGPVPDGYLPYRAEVSLGGGPCTWFTFITSTPRAQRLAPPGGRRAHAALSDDPGRLCVALYVVPDDRRRDFKLYTLDGARVVSVCSSAAVTLYWRRFDPEETVPMRALA